MREAVMFQIRAFHTKCPSVVTRERDGSVGLTEYFCVVVGFGVGPSKHVFVHIGRRRADQCIGILRVDLESQFEWVRLAPRRGRHSSAAVAPTGGPRPDRGMSRSMMNRGFLERAAVSASAPTSS